MRLRKAFPSVPIYVRTDRRESAKRLLEAGATDVIVETERVAEALRTMVSRFGTTTSSALKGGLWADGNNSQDVNGLPPTEIELADLAFECNKTPEELKELYEMFSTSLDKNDRGEVNLAELRDDLLRRRSQPLDDESLARWLGYQEAVSKWATEDAEERWVTFPEFVRFSARTLERD